MIGKRGVWEGEDYFKLVTDKIISAFFIIFRWSQLENLVR